MRGRPLVSLSPRELAQLTATAEALQGARSAADDAAGDLARAAFLSAVADDLDTARRARAALHALRGDAA